MKKLISSHMDTTSENQGKRGAIPMFQLSCQLLVGGVSQINFDGLVKSRKMTVTVIPAKAGIQKYRIVTECLDTGFHRCDDFLRVRQL